MDFGIALATTTESWRIAARAEAEGLSHVWFYDTQLLNPDVFIGMALAAHHTTRIRLGTGVLVPSNRLSAVTANAFATLNRLAPGRLDFGVGTGFTARRTMGQGAIPLARLARYVREVQELLAGRTVVTELEGEARRIGFLNPDLGLINTTDPVALHLSAMGPKGRRLTAELEAGWIDFAGAVGPAVKALGDMQRAWQAAGRAPAALYSTLFTLGRVLDAGEAYDSPAAIAEAGPYVAVFLHNLVETTRAGQMDGVLSPAAARALEQWRAIHAGFEPADAPWLYNHRGHLMFIKPEERALIGAELVREMSFTGEPDELVARIRQLRDAGFSQFTVQLVEGSLDALDRWVDVFRRV